MSELSQEELEMIYDEIVDCVRPGHFDCASCAPEDDGWAITVHILRKPCPCCLGETPTVDDLRGILSEVGDD